MFTAATYSDEDGDEARKPLPPLPHVEGTIADKRSSETDEARNDDTDLDVYVSWTDGRESLAASDRRGERKPGHRCGIEEKRDGNEIVPEPSDISHAWDTRTVFCGALHINLPKGIPGLHKLPQPSV